MGSTCGQIGRDVKATEQSMNDTYMTIVGNVVDDPRQRNTNSGHAVTNFRVASTSRRFDRETNRFVDNATLFVNVTCWRATAENVGQSVRKGQPVIVTGRFYQREYTVDEQVKFSYELEASAVGHDLSRGTADFKKVVRPRSMQVEADADGLPADRSDEWLGLADAHSADSPVTAQSRADADLAVAVG
jgi:single-strand DNA-binding protein